MTKKIKNDRALRFYKDVLELDRLHYGMWEPDDELTFANLRTAQQRYEQYLIDRIPEGVKSVLDVGCGTGILASNLKKVGYSIEGLSPDIAQKEVFPTKVQAPFHHCCFEDFEPDKTYDLVIMSESSQYINLDRLFEVAKQTVAEGGYLMACDYYVLDNAEGVFRKSGHNFNEFLKRAEDAGFNLITNDDVTKPISKTMDLGKHLVEKLFLSIELGTEKIRHRRPWLSRLVAWLFRKKITKVKEDALLFDADLFAKNKTYRFLLFKKQS